MKINTPDPADGAPGDVPTIETERHFLAQCEYINRKITATGRLVRRLLRERGWSEEWSEAEEDTVWHKVFPDGAVAQLPEDEAYGFEEEYTRQYFRDSGIAMKPRGPKPPPE